MTNTQSPLKSLLFGGSSLIFLAIIFFIGFASGHTSGVRSIVPEGEGRVIGKEVDGRSVEEDIDFALFWEVWNAMKEEYLYRPVSETDLFYGAISGMVKAAGDDYSVFFRPVDAQAFNADLEGTFFGIGAEIGERNDQLVVIAPLTGSPAETSGVRAGDAILAINDEDSYDLTVTEAVQRIRGEEGTEVKLTMLRDGEILDISIIRAEIHLDSVAWEIRPDGVAVIDVYMFNEETSLLFEQATEDIIAAGASALIVDLRNNPGGLLSTAIDLAGYWVQDEPVVIERIGDRQNPFFSSGRGELANLKTVVLMNGGSASASEILAGALRDYGYATIMGEKSFGKGSVQDYFEYGDGSALKITVAEWLTPNGHSIQDVGIEPDIYVEYTIDDYNAENTPQIDAALNFLKTGN
ncbi:MAG: S41 family peptidase [bacterium]|nr:S41 family peptidase [bacterium]